MAEDVSDTPAQRLALSFFCKCVLTWGQASPVTNGTDGTDPNTALPGFEQFIYERLVPLSFSIPANPSFNIRDGQAIVVSQSRIHFRPGHNSSFVRAKGYT